MQPKRSVDGYRSLPHKRPFIAAALLALVHYLSLIAAITLGYILTRVEKPDVKIGFIVAIGIFALSWLIGYFRRASAKCPLCKGTPLLDSAASKHKKAYRLRPLNYGTTAQISLLMGHRFRCMYCGTGFDLLRKSSNVREQSSREF
ncbi:hypothetical protein [Haloferula sp.]|uniref:hypothetical protein n=1 Tax=Haloferula sp. TaxID=2497595 RepID=UPI00329EEA9A